jgi:hypothetical protein
MQGRCQGPRIENTASEEHDWQPQVEQITSASRDPTRSNTRTTRHGPVSRPEVSTCHSTSWVTLLPNNEKWPRTVRGARAEHEESMEEPPIAILRRAMPESVGSTAYRTRDDITRNASHHKPLATSKELCASLRPRRGGQIDWAGKCNESAAKGSASMPETCFPGTGGVRVRSSLPKLRVDEPAAGSTDAACSAGLLSSFSE